jgi:hypothetical protein
MEAAQIVASVPRLLIRVVDLDAVSYATKLVRLDFPKHRFRDMEPEFQEEGSVVVHILLVRTCVDIVKVGVDNLIVWIEDCAENIDQRTVIAHRHGHRCALCVICFEDVLGHRLS